MNRSISFTLGIAVAALAVAGPLCEAEALNSATVSRVENKVSYGKVIDDRSETRPAAPNDVIQADNFLLSETDSRAELKYEDGTLVRIGQNTIFSFEANHRTLNLKKGTFVFYMPKGKGGGTIKTPSFTAAITGTVGKVSTNTIAILEGEITLVPSLRKVAAGFFARVNADGSVDILPFDLTKEFNGKLMTFNGPIPGLPDQPGGSLLDLFSNLDREDVFDRVNNMPSSVRHFNPTPKPTATPRVQQSTPPPATPRPATPTPIPTPLPR